MACAGWRKLGWPLRRSERYKQKRNPLLSLLRIEPWLLNRPAYTRHSMKLSKSSVHYFNAVQLFFIFNDILPFFFTLYLLLLVKWRREFHNVYCTRQIYINHFKNSTTHNWIRFHTYRQLYIELNTSAFQYVHKQQMSVQTCKIILLLHISPECSVQVVHCIRFPVCPRYVHDSPVITLKIMLHSSEHHSHSHN